MIIDVHSHAWRFPQDFSGDFMRQAQRARAGQPVDLAVRHEDYAASASVPVRTIVFGGKARLSGVWVDDAHVASYVAQHPDQLIGFLSVDPTQDGWEREMRSGHEDLGLRGIKLLPMYAGFSPDDATLEPLWKYAKRHALPVLLHMGTKRYFRLTRTGAPIWAMLEAGRDAGAIAQSLAETFEVSMTDAEESVAVLLAELRAAALICERAPAE